MREAISTTSQSPTMGDIKKIITITIIKIMRIINHLTNKETPHFSTPGLISTRRTSKAHNFSIWKTLLTSKEENLQKQKSKKSSKKIDKSVLHSA